MRIGNRKRCRREAERSSRGHVGPAEAWSYRVTLEGLDGPVLAQLTHMDAHVGAAGGKRVVALPVHIQSRGCREAGVRVRGQGSGRQNTRRGTWSEAAAPQANTAEPRPDLRGSVPTPQHAPEKGPRVKGRIPVTHLSGTETAAWPLLCGRPK